ncbi:MAG: hypothetical protein JNL40_02145 [Cyclobacteriaceae bacterium]|nr:hypothetical protein [Cyclobacteriaceae bacterium]
MLRLTSVLLVFLATRCLAQQPAPPSNIPKEKYPKSSEYNLHNVKVVLRDGTKFKGRLIYLDRKQVILKRYNTNQRRTVATKEIESIDMVSKRSVRQAAAGGFVAGAVLGFAIGSSGQQMALTTGAVVGGIGAVFGATIGGIIGSRRTKFPIKGQEEALSDFALLMKLED